jgi:hypothetical protein
MLPSSLSRQLPLQTRRLFLTALSVLLTAVFFQPRAVAQAAAKPTPDVLIFTNGDQLTGSVLRGVGDSIVFKSEMAGEITVPLAKIKELHSISSFAVLRKDTPITRAAVTPGTIAVVDGALTVSTTNAAPQAVPAKELAYIVDAPTYAKEIRGGGGFLHGWNGAITAGASLIRSTQNGSTFTAGITASRIYPDVAYLPRRNRTLFNLAEAYGKLTQPIIPPPNPPTGVTESVAKTNIFHTDVEQDQYFTSRFYALGTVAFDHNFSQGLNLQQLYGGGFGWSVIQTPVQQLDLSASIHYEKQAFQVASSNQNLIGATIADAYLRHLPGKLLFTQTANFLPAFNNSNAYSANFTAGLALPVYHRFSVSFNTADNYLNNPSPGYKKNSYQFVTGITYTLR